MHTLHRIQLLRNSCALSLFSPSFHLLDDKEASVEGAWSLNHYLEERCPPTRNLHFGQVSEREEKPCVSEHHTRQGLVCYRVLI